MTPVNTVYPKEYIYNPHKLGENRLPARTMVIPAQKRGVTHRNFTESDRIRLLDGDWRFSYREEDAAEAFYDPARSDESWDALPVPSMWQFQGYGSCCYPNVRYPFPYDPPYIHRTNPVGLESADDYPPQYADMDGDGIVSPGDARTILRVSVGLE